MKNRIQNNIYNKGVFLNNFIFLFIFYNKLKKKVVDVENMQFYERSISKSTNKASLPTWINTATTNDKTHEQLAKSWPTTT